MEKRASRERKYNTLKKRVENDKGVDHVQAPAMGDIICTLVYKIARLEQKVRELEERERPS